MWRSAKVWLFCFKDLCLVRLCIWVSFSVRYFRAVSGSGYCWAEGTEVFFCVPPALYMHRLCIVNVPYLSSTIDRPPWTHDYHLKSIVYIRVHSWCCTFYAFGQICNDISIIVISYTVLFIALKILCAPPFHPSSSQTLATIDFFTISLFLPFLEYHISEITICSLLGLAST